MDFQKKVCFFIYLHYLKRYIKDFFFNCEMKITQNVVMFISFLMKVNKKSAV